MELLQLIYFCEVARTESMTKAALNFHIPQPSMSQTIARLEKELDVELFDRAGKRIYLNSAGREFLFHTERALAEISAGSALVGNHKDYGDRKLNLLVLQDRNILTNWQIEFATSNPDVAFVIHHGLRNPASCSYDFIFASQAPGDSNYDATELIQEKIVLAVSHSHPLSRLASVTAEDIRQEKFVLFTEKMSISTIALDYCRSAGFTPDIAVACDDPFYVRKYVTAGMGISLVPSKSWDGLWDESVVFIPIGDIDLIRTTYMYHRHGMPLSPYAAKFKEFILFKSKSTGMI